MDPHLHEWLNLVLRWIHLIAGIAWIGSSFYFIWLDSSLEEEEPEKADAKIEGSLWMVHSGGFYKVEKRKIGPGEMPPVLHWFKWEATLTWITGIFLLTLIYYLTNGTFLLDPAVSTIPLSHAILLGVGLLIGSWFVYDGLYQSPLGRNTFISTTLSLGLISGVTYFLCQTLSGRAAYIHIGALFGTLMVVNVWKRILPAQQQMIDATKEGKTPDFTLGKHAKRRSVHNSYMTFPVLFIMLSNHYPMTYGNKYNWVILLLLIIVGAGIRHVMIVKSKKSLWTLLPVVAAVVILFILTMPTQSNVSMQIGTVSFEQVKAIVANRCTACHSTSPTDPTFGPSPGGVSFDDPARIAPLSVRIKERVVIYKTMPMANKTGITEEERQMLRRWIDDGAKMQ